jgi:hypothetical protein
MTALACNPSYSGNRDQEDHGSTPVQENSLQDCISKITNTKKGWQSTSSGTLPITHEGLSSNPSTTKKKKKDRQTAPRWKMAKQEMMIRQECYLLSSLRNSGGSWEQEKQPHKNRFTIKEMRGQRKKRTGCCQAQAGLKRVCYKVTGVETPSWHLIYIMSCHYEEEQNIMFRLFL